MAKQKSVKDAIATPLIGLLIIGISFAMWSRIQPYEDGVITTGTIIGEIRVNSSDGDTFKPQIQFQTEDGQTIIFEPRSSSSARSETGDTVRISYLPGDPQSARNLDTALAWLLYPVFALGAAFFVIGIWSLVSPQRGRSSSFRNRSSLDSRPVRSVDMLPESDLAVKEPEDRATTEPAAVEHDHISEDRFDEEPPEPTWGEPIETPRGF